MKKIQKEFEAWLNKHITNPENHKKHRCKQGRSGGYVDAHTQDIFTTWLSVRSEKPESEYGKSKTAKGGHRNLYEKPSDKALGEVPQTICNLGCAME